MPESVTDNPAKMRYEIYEDGEVAGYITYAQEGFQLSACRVL